MIYKDQYEYSNSDISEYKIKGKKGTRIYREYRRNHIKGMVRVRGGVERLVYRHDYLVIVVKNEKPKCL